MLYKFEGTGGSSVTQKASTSTCPAAIHATNLEVSLETPAYLRCRTAAVMANYVPSPWSHSALPPLQDSALLANSTRCKLVSINTQASHLQQSMGNIGSSRAFNSWGVVQASLEEAAGLQGRLREAETALTGAKGQLQQRDETGKALLHLSVAAV